MNKSESLKLWEGMPDFNQQKLEPAKKIKVTFLDGSYIFVRFENAIDYNKFKYRKMKLNFSNVTAQRELFSKVTMQKITNKTKSIWFPFKSHWGGIKCKYVSNKNIPLKYPVYIVSKGRAKNGLTWKALKTMGIQFKVIVEDQELSEYSESVGKENILILPKKYLDEYNTCDNLGDSLSKGPGAARNFARQHSIDNGQTKHWVLDDNLDAFHYLTDNEKYEVECSSTFRACEDFTDRFSNVPLSGMNYYSFCKKTDPVPPFVLNTRIYSCLLIDNKAGYKWRGRYNEDTDLSLRILKDGLCTIQFNAFLCGKVTTQRMKGGNSKEFYNNEGTLPKSQMIADLHPDVAKVIWKFNRWHHLVNYKKYSDNLLIKSPLEKEFIDYGLIKVSK